MTITQKIHYRYPHLGEKAGRFFLVLFIIGGLFAAIMATAWVASNHSTYLLWVVAGAVAAVAGMLAYRLGKLEYGILAIIPVATLLNFFSLPTGTESRLVLSLLLGLALVLLWLFQVTLYKRGRAIKPSIINTPIWLFAAINIVSLIWGNLVRDPQVYVWPSFPFVQLGAMTVNILLPLFALFVSNRFEDRRWSEWVTWIFLGISTFIIVTTLLKVPAVSRLYDNGYRGLFGPWSAALAFSMALFNQKLSKWTRGLLLGLTLAWFFHDFILHADWFSGWVPMLTGLLMVLLIRSRKAFAIVVAIGLVIFIVKYNYFYQNYYVANYYNQGGNQRVGLWAINIQLIELHPLFGTGPAGYAVYYMTYNPTDARSTHNNYFDVISQYGVVGFVIFIWMMTAFARVVQRGRRLVQGTFGFEEAFLVASLAGLIGAMVSMALGDWVLPFAYNQTISGFDNAVFTWLFLGCGVSLYNILSKKYAMLPAEKQAVR